MNKKRGFTLVEMLIVAPIVILVIGIFVSAIIGMTGDVLTIRSENDLSLKVQNALNSIDIDVKSSNGFLATNSFTLSAGQGYDDGVTSTTAFNNANSVVSGKGTMLILKSYATTSNPLNTTRSYVYNKLSPNACSSALIKNNSVLMMNTVYFVKNYTLWRRIVAPSTYLDTTNTVCSTPWQQPTCVLGYTATFCKTQDAKLIEGVKTTNDFIVTYYDRSNTAITAASDSNNSDATRQTALNSAKSIKVYINATKTIAGHAVTQSSTIRTSLP